MAEKPNQNQSVLSFSLKDKNALYTSYMPFVKNGAIFIPTTRDYEMGTEVFMLLNIMSETERFPINGKSFGKRRAALMVIVRPVLVFSLAIKTPSLKTKLKCI